MSFSSSASLRLRAGDARFELCVDSAFGSCATDPVPIDWRCCNSDGAAEDSPRAAKPSGTPATLSLKDAQALALKNNPQISVARLGALASLQVTRQVRSSLWPTASVDLTAVDANPGTRITAGALNNPIIYQRAAAGAMVSQLLTDFGRTTNLVSSANLAAKAENQNALATKEQILLAVDQAFYNALQSQAVLTVAQQTVKERQTVATRWAPYSRANSSLNWTSASPT